MSKQLSFTDLEYANRKKITKREIFLRNMDRIIPWAEWVEMIEPYYYKNTRGRKAKSIETMLRMYLLQNWFNLSDAGVEDAIYDSFAMWNFMGIDFVEEQVPDATTLLHFRHLIEEKHIGEHIFEDINIRLEEAGLMMRGGTIMDATIIEAPSSTKNEDGKRDPDMHQTQKGNQWYFGMKAHAGADAGSGYVHTVTATAANVSDITEAHKLIRKDDEVVYGDSGYTGIEKRDEIKKDEQLSKIDYRINKRPKSVKTYNDAQIENRKSSVRCKVEHPFQLIKQFFGYRKTIYRGLAKNLNKLYILFGCANLVMCMRAGRVEEFCSCKL